MNTSNVAALITMGMLLAACGGGGGGGGGGPASVPGSFTSFSAIRSNQAVQADGMSQTFTAVRDPNSSLITSVTFSAVDTTVSNAQLSYGALPVMSAFSFTTPAGVESFSGSAVTCPALSGVCGGTRGPTEGAVINPLDAPGLQWNYQSFGYWVSFPTATSASGGAISFGAVTPVAGVPTVGTATYQGLSSGVYVDATGAGFIHGAQMVSNVDFAARSISFATTSSVMAPPGSSAVTPNAGLDMSGTLTYSAGTNSFSGPVTTAGGGGTPAMSGTARGRFYGPHAEEIGGVYSLTGTGPQAMSGAYGGKK